MKASCDDLILLRAAQKQYGADENKPEHPADPFTILNKGIRRPDNGLMPCEGDSEWLRTMASSALAKSALHPTAEKDSRSKEGELLD